MNIFKKLLSLRTGVLVGLILSLFVIPTISYAQFQTIPVSTEEITTTPIISHYGASDSLAAAGADSSAILNIRKATRVELWIDCLTSSGAVRTSRIAVSVRKHLTETGTDSSSTFAILPGYVGQAKTTAANPDSLALTLGIDPAAATLGTGEIGLYMGDPVKANSQRRLVVCLQDMFGSDFKGGWISVKVRNLNTVAAVDIKVYLVKYYGPE